MRPSGRAGLFQGAVQAYLQNIGKLIGLCGCSSDATLAEGGKAAERTERVVNLHHTVAVTFIVLSGLKGTNLSQIRTVLNRIQLLLQLLLRYGMMKPGRSRMNMTDGSSENFADYIGGRLFTFGRETKPVVVST